MFTRIALLVAGLGLIALPVPARAVEDSDASTPTLVVRVSSINDLMEDVKFIASLGNQTAGARKLDDAVKKVFPKGIQGIDANKPLALYGKLDPSGSVLDSIAVIAVPITGEKDFLGLLEDHHIEPKKEEGGIYSVTLDNVPFPIYFRFSDGYVWATLRDKDSISKGKSLPLSRIIPAGSTDTATVIFRIDQIPDGFKQIGQGQMELRLSELEERKPRGQSDAEHAVQVQAIKETAKQLSSIIRDGTELKLVLNVDRQAKKLGVELSLAGKKGSELAKQFAEIGGGKSRFAALPGGEGPVNVLINLTLPPGVQNTLASGYEQTVQDELKKEKDATKREIIAEILKALAPTVKSGAMDAALSLRGPSANNHYAFVVAVGLKDGDEVEKALRDIVKKLPPSEIEKRVRMDAETINGVKVHRLDVQQDMDADAKRHLGAEPLYFAIRNDAAFLAGGEGGFEALKQALSVEPGSARPLEAKVSVAGLVPLMDKDMYMENPVELARKIFGTSTPHDKVHVAVQGGDAIRLHVDFDADALRFLAQIGESEKKPPRAVRKPKPGDD